jgi:hypothetical protein
MEPLPLVPATCMARHGSGVRASRRAIRWRPGLIMIESAAAEVRRSCLDGSSWPQKQLLHQQTLCLSVIRRVVGALVPILKSRCPRSYRQESFALLPAGQSELSRENAWQRSSLASANVSGASERRRVNNTINTPPLSPPPIQSPLPTRSHSRSPLLYLIFAALVTMGLP